MRDAHDRLREERDLLAEKLASTRSELQRLQHDVLTMQQSFIYRAIARPIWGLRRRLLPEDSRRYKLYQQARQLLGLRAQQTQPQDLPEQATNDMQDNVILNVPVWDKPTIQAETQQPVVICTIISKNYLAFARTLMESIRSHHHNIHLVVLLVDTIDGYYDPQQEIFETLLAEELNIPLWQHFAMKYSILELNTAVKPYLLEVLFNRYQAEKVIYFDPDIVVYHPLDDLLAILDAHNLVLTPHVTKPIDDTFVPTEYDILRSGIYNLGFVAFSRLDNWRGLLHWWQHRLYHHCVVNPDQHLFVDQRWMDFAPALSESAYILRDAGYNVAYWNIKERMLTYDAHNAYAINGTPLIFFHFSGFSATNPEIVSKHQNRFILSDLSQATIACFEDYAKRLYANGHEASKDWPYAYGYFENGIPISIIAHQLLRKYDLNGETWPTPFDDSFFSWITTPVTATLSRYALQLYAMRPDLKLIFPDVPGLDERKFANWFINTEEDDALFHEGYTAPIKAALGEDYTPVQKAHAVDDKPGVNLIGYAYSETGIGQQLRNMLQALVAQGIPISVQPIITDMARKEDFTVASYPQGTPYPINVFHVNADMTYAVQEHIPQHAYQSHYNIALWSWELAEFPQEWAARCAVYDEIWTPSTFISDGVKAITTLPVHTIPNTINIQADPTLTRDKLNLPEDAFIVYFAFDALSVFERKNPLAIVAAFRKAFTDADNAKLVIKANNLHRHPKEAHQLKQALALVNGILIDTYLSRREVNALYAQCDVYLSLHRSEGYGLTLAEAMTLGKPVIATGYSGNLDFMNQNNSYIVPYTLIELERDYAIYKAGNHWADPDIEAAAAYLRQVYDNPQDAALVGQRAAAYMRTHHSQEAVGRYIESLLQAIT
jgi:glycosyltransferase involved in cell wall biosynthesis